MKCNQRLVTLFSLVTVLFFTTAHTAQHNRDFLLNRPSVYFGQQTKAQNPLYFGLMWNEYLAETQAFLNIREQTEYADRVPYQLRNGDGVNFGRVTMHDTLYMDVNLTATYVRPDSSNSSFAARIEGVSNSDESSAISLYFYVGVDSSDTAASLTAGVNGIVGYSSDFTSSFQLNITSASSPYESVPLRFFSNFSETPFWLADTLQDVLKHDFSSQQILPNENCEGSGMNNFAIVQKILKTPFAVEIEFNDAESPLAADFNLDEWYNTHQKRFVDRYNVVFSPNSGNENDIEVEYSSFGQQVLSHLIGGLSYFRGSRYYLNATTGHRVEIPDVELFSCVPSKTGFPRPFFWDEGFHQMAVSKWDPETFEKVFESWFALNIDGWIVREMIIGKEAQAHSPEWAWAQSTLEMNPPIFYITLYDYIFEGGSVVIERVAFLQKVWSLLKKTYEWYLENTQTGPSTYLFKWNGRITDRSLDSGFDDFPRFDTPRGGECNVDMQSWMCKMAKVMSKFASLVGDDPSSYENDYKQTLTKLKTMFWDPDTGFFFDIDTSSGIEHLDHIGVVGMLPLCLGLVSDESVIVEAMLNHFLNESELFDEVGGIRSLSAADPRYTKTEVGPKGVYWRGAIWGNMNYLCYQALGEFNSTNPHYERASKLRSHIHDSYIGIVYDGYMGKKDGSIYEIYHPENGGPFSHFPFTGWTASSVLLMLAGGYPNMKEETFLELLLRRYVPLAVVSLFTAAIVLYVVSGYIAYFIYLNRKNIVNLIMKTKIGLRLFRKTKEGLNLQLETQPTEKKDYEQLIE